MTRIMRARFGFFVGVVLAAAGLGWAVAPGWGLVVAGVGTMFAFVWLYDVADPPPPDENRLRRGGDW